MLRWKKTCIASSTVPPPTSSYEDIARQGAARSSSVVSDDSSACPVVSPTENLRESTSTTSRVPACKEDVDGGKKRKSMHISLAASSASSPRPYDEEDGFIASSLLLPGPAVYQSELSNGDTVPSIGGGKENHAFPASGSRLLSTANDATHLNALHCFVRQNTQIFLANREDIEAPAPGRKKKIAANQVGLRCIHCLHLPTLERVKRAVCYPSNIGRIYHCISDMKFDHFGHCPEIPEQKKIEFQSLKAACCKKKESKVRSKTNSRSTARYYYESAKRLGLVERDGGVFLDTSNVIGSVEREHECISPSLSSISSVQAQEPRSSERLFSKRPEDNGVISRVSPELEARPTVKAVSSVSEAPPMKPLPLTDALSCREGSRFPGQILKPSEHKLVHYCHKPTDSHMEGPQGLSTPSFSPNSCWRLTNEALAVRPSDIGAVTGFSSTNHLATGSMSMRPFTCNSGNTQVSPTLQGPKRCLLAMQEDPFVLNALHCFVRQNIEVFAATKEDIAVPAPGRRNRVVVGQVGIRCIHCRTMPFKDRVKRACCYPPTVGGIYHCVSNMKFDHFESCRGIPEDVRSKLLQLKATCNRKGGTQSANCTAQYYLDSAERLGLADTKDGICFGVVSSSSRSQVPVENPIAGVSAQPSDTSTRSVCPETVPDGLSALVIAAASHTAMKEGHRCSAALHTKNSARLPPALIQADGGSEPNSLASSRQESLYSGAVTYQSRLQISGLALKQQQYAFAEAYVGEGLLSPSMKRIRCD